MEKIAQNKNVSPKKIGTLIKTFQGQRKNKAGVTYDTLLFLYRDENGEKKRLFYDRPITNYYIIKDKNSPEAKHPPMYIERNKVDEVTCYSDLLFRDIASKTDTMDFYYRVKTNNLHGDRAYEMKNLFKHEYIYGADTDLVDKYIANFYENFTPDKKYKLHKCYFDIEVDLMPNGFADKGYIGFPEEDIAPCPVNVITLIDGKTKKVYTFVHHNKKNKTIQALQENTESFTKNLIKKIKDEDFVDISSIDISMYDNELDVIKAFFDKTHEIDPDFMLAWNQCYDVITLMNRIKYLIKKDKYNGMLSIVCDSRYSLNTTAEGKTIYTDLKAYYKKHKSRKPGEGLDFFNVLDGINWIDQMRYYAVIRRGDGQRDTYALDAVAYDELGTVKLPYAPGETIKNRAWLNFSKFTEYNIRDVLLLMMIEDKCKDMDKIQRLSEIANTRKEKVFSKSILIPNFITKYSKQYNYIMNTNMKINYGADGEYFSLNYMHSKKISDPDPKYEYQINHDDKKGAFVIDPGLIDNVGMDLGGKFYSQFLFEHVCDQDLSSLYPSIIRAFNIDSASQVGKFILIDDKIKDRLKNNFGMNGLFNLSDKDSGDDDSEEDTKSIFSNTAETNDLGPTLVDDLMSAAYSVIGEQFFFLPSTDECINEIGDIIKLKKSTQN